MMCRDRLTGVIRHRTGFGGRQILQVQVEGESYDHNGGGSWSPTYTNWRDAKSYEAQNISKDTINNAKEAKQ